MLSHSFNSNILDRCNCCVLCSLNYSKCYMKSKSRLPVTQLYLPYCLQINPEHEGIEGVYKMSVVKPTDIEMLQKGIECLPQAQIF